MFSKAPGKGSIGGPIGGVLYFIVVICLGLYFTFASVQGDYGLFRRVQINAEAKALEIEREAMAQEIAALSNKTLRLSDDYLDLDLLDEQARDILGLVRADEIVLR
ncbi:MAG TPA: septum formation initiator family protein [Aliiroseovarius sp.]|nr:septum formation initiator family protein [Aliiroseovarius sp.]